MQTRFLPPLAALGLACFTVSLVGAEQQTLLTVHAGPVDRVDSVVSVALPDWPPQVRTLRFPAGSSLVQIDDFGQAWFIVKNLKAGQSQTGPLQPLPPERTATNQTSVKRDGDVLNLIARGQTVLQYQGAKSKLPREDLKPVFQRGGYLHPVLSPSGKLLTDDYPSNHKHHHGIWFPWTKTEFQGRHPDFWNMGDGTGTVEFTSLGETWSGPVQSGFLARHRFVDLSAPQPVAALNETWDVRVYGVGAGVKPYFMFDLVSTQTCATADPLKLPEYYYGGLGFRGNWDWNGADKTSFLTSEGETDRVKGNNTRGRWCHIGGKVDGALTGIAILSHPDNFRAPQPMRLHPKEPFFCFAPSALGDWEITPGKPYVSRYRYIVADGPPDKTELDRLWNDYAHPAAVTVETR